jgi:lipoprotein NlpI
MRSFAVFGEMTLSLLLVIPALASPASPEDANMCYKLKSSAAIAPCTRVIEDPKSSQDDRAFGYLNRGVAYMNNDDYEHAIADFDKAIPLASGNNLVYLYNDRGNAFCSKDDWDRGIADYTEAIRLAPDFVLSYLNRGQRYLDKGEFQRAAADFSQVIRLSPKFPGGYLGRGIANLYAGSRTAALADLIQATTLAPKDGEYALWLDIVTSRSKLPSRLPQAVEKIDLTEWPGPVIRVYLGQSTLETALSSADNPLKMCSANFYLGQLALQRHDKDLAAGLFRSAATNCPKGRVEREAATVELKALSAAR